MLKRLAVHPVQYALVGLALAFFYLLLLSLFIGLSVLSLQWSLQSQLARTDVATTNLLVEFLVVVLMMLVLRHQPRLYLRDQELNQSAALIRAAARLVVGR